MSSPLAIGAVSAVLRNLLDNGLVDVSGMLGPVAVSAVAPDRVDVDEVNFAPRLNLFMYLALPNAAWRNRDLPSRSGTGERVSNAPLALDLHYLVTAYGVSDFQAEIMLGYAMHLLHERPVLDRASIRRALDPSPLDVSMLPPAFQALAASDLADQIEVVRITPVPMNTDEMSKLWSASQSHYRPSAAYQVCVVLIEGARPARSPLPVLSRGPADPATGRDRGVVVQPDLLPPGPTILSITPPNRQSAAVAGDLITLVGVRLEGSGVRARLRHRLLASPLEVAATVATGGASASFTLPAGAAAQIGLPAGLMQLSLALTPTGELVERKTNALPLLIAPDPVILADAGLGLAAIAIQRLAGPARVTVRMFSRPEVRPEQASVLALGTATAVAARRSLATDPLDFEFPDSLAVGLQWLRLRVDGVDSLLVDKSTSPPSFDPSYQVTVPA
jgi:Pvc16 N-terminal domain